MSITKINEAVVHQPLRDFLTGAVTFNPAAKGVVAGQNSLVHPALSTAGSLVINGTHIATIAASSTFFALEQATVPAYGGVAYVCCINAAGSGIGYKSDVLTSAQMSTASSTYGGVACSNIENAVVMPDIPATMCPVAIYTVAAGDSAHVAGSETFSAATSNGASHAYRQVFNMNTINTR